MKKIAFLTLTSMIALHAWGQRSPASTLNGAMDLFRRQDYKSAAAQFYKTAFSGKASEKDAMAARYYLGLSLMKLKLYQTATFPLIVSTKDAPPKVAKKAFENLAVASEHLNDSGLLDYALRKLDASDLSDFGRELYHIRLAQAKMRQGEYEEAIQNLKESLELKSENDEALYTMGLVYLKQNKAAEAIPYLEKLYNKYFNRPATDRQRGSATMALARAYYHTKKFAEAAYLYRQLPKDHPLYRESQTELTWSLFRQAKFRSAMSAVQTLHTPFYENFYDPESLILRTIIFLFVCQNDEAEKALQTFQSNYTAAHAVLEDITKTNETPDFYFKQIAETQKYLKELRRGKDSIYQGKIPFFMVRTLIDQGALKNKLIYLARIQDEKTLGDKIFAGPTYADLRKYMTKIITARSANIRKEAGQLLRTGLAAKAEELTLFNGDGSLLAYEVLNGKKKEARQKYIQSLSNAPLINADDDRDFYIQNGYRYWPFEGEFWRDEIGNYQYLGINRCVQD